MKLKDGCPGCERRWNAPAAEGQCSRCKRCLACCSNETVALSCVARERTKRANPKFSVTRSRRAYEQYHANPGVLSRNRRMT